MQHSKLLDNEVALVTGGASGLGLAIVERFLAEGARVAILDSSSERLHDVERSLDPSIVTISGDVRNLSANVEAVDRTVRAFGRLTILIANAGIYDEGLSLAEIEPGVLESAFDEIVGINLKGYVFAAKAAFGELKRHRGTIVFTSSVSGQFAGFGGFLYVTVKHALSGLTRQLAIEFAPDVRVNAVAPGYVKTNLQGLSSQNQRRSSTSGDPDPARFLLKTVPKADEYAGVYALLASRSCGTIMTGSTILADAGASLQRARGD